MKVLTKNKGTVKMTDLQLGDEILVDESGVFEPIYSFGHRDRLSLGEFLQISTDKNVLDPLELSETHMVSAGRRFLPASMVQIGDKLTMAGGEEARVTSIKKVVQKGLYAPFTSSGTLFVNGVKASSYVSFQDSEVLKIGNYRTPLSFQGLAQTFQLPHRMTCHYLTCLTEDYTTTGISQWVYRPLLFTHWWLRQNGVIMFWVLLLVLPFLLLMLTTEVVWQHPTIAMVLILTFVLHKNLLIRRQKIQPTMAVV